MAHFGEALKKVAIFLGETAQEALRDSHDAELSEAMSEGRRNQEKDDILRAVLAFIELKQDDAQIHRLLSTYFKVDSITEADDYIHTAKYTIVRTRLKEYCLQNGMSSADFFFFEKGADIKAKLITNPRLFDMPTAKLKSMLDKENNK